MTHFKGFRSLLLLLWLMTGCTPRPPNEAAAFDKILPGWTREDVIGLVGEPTEVRHGPFENGSTSHCLSSAHTEMVFKIDEGQWLLVYLDENDTVLCKSERFRFIEE